MHVKSLWHVSRGLGSQRLASTSHQHNEYWQHPDYTDQLILTSTGYCSLYTDRLDTKNA